MSENNAMDLAALLCSRLCHDLISPVGAIGNGIELLGDGDEDDAMRGEIIKLLKNSATETANRLKFFRLAFGAAGGFASEVPLDDAKSATEGLFSNSHVNLTWDSEIGVMNKSAIKMTLNMLLVAGESLIRGGDLGLNIISENEKTTLTISASGSKVIFQEVIRKTLLSEETGVKLETKTVPAYLVSVVAKELNTEIIYKACENDGFILTVTF